MLECYLQDDAPGAVEAQQVGDVALQDLNGLIHLEPMQVNLITQTQSYQNKFTAVGMVPLATGMPLFHMK